MYEVSLQVDPSEALKVPLIRYFLISLILRYSIDICFEHSNSNESLLGKLVILAPVGDLLPYTAKYILGFVAVCFPAC